MNIHEIHARLLRPFRPWIVSADLEAIDPWIEVRADGLPEIARFLLKDRELAFDMLHCVTAVDYLEAEESKTAKTGPEKGIGAVGAEHPEGPSDKGCPSPFPASRLELIYHLSSTTQRHRLVLKVRLPRWFDDQAGQLPEMQSVSSIWSTADWHEREVFDLMGVYFVDHSDLRRILCPEDWEGHPLRKDYQMPAEYHGIPSR